jgi:hypothetical protein
MKDKFERLPAFSAGGTGLISRLYLNPSLIYSVAIDMEHFRNKLKMRFGDPDKCDAGFSYSICEVHTGIKFEAYSAQSGPKYGGEIDLFDDQNKPHFIREDVLDILYEFDVWIENSLGQGE